MPESLLQKLSQAGPDTQDPRFEHLQQLTVMQPQDSLTFSCRGCGDNCCTTDTPIVLSIPEVGRMSWHVVSRLGLADAFRMAGIGATRTYIGHSSRQRVQVLNHKDGHCGFVAHMWWTNGEQLNGCAIHEQRPNTCRVFPSGPIMAVDEQSGEAQEEFVLSGNCPGFEDAGPGDAVVEGYTPPAPEQTMQDWVDSNLPAENRAETRLACEVLNRFTDSGAHAPTDTLPGGYWTRSS